MTESNISYDKALAYAHKLFTFRPRSEKELRERLNRRGYNSAVIDRVITEYKQKGLLNDERFAKLWGLSRLQSKPSSLLKIKHELALKGIDPQTTENVLGQLKEDFDEYETAKALAEKRMRFLTRLDKLNPHTNLDRCKAGKVGVGVKAKKRLFDYLKRRGFSSDITYKVLNETFKDDA